MKSYQLLGQEGIGSGIWECGECHKPHLVATKANKPVSDMNRKAAEKCCAPRNCRYCGQITERDWSGQFRWAHEACIPKYEPTPPHPSMVNPYARLLYKKMSDISEDCWCAGWMSGNEYALWKVLHGDRHDYGCGGIAYEDLEEVRVPSEHADGWIWTGPEKEYTPQLVSFAEWESILAAWGDSGDDLVSEFHAPGKGGMRILTYRDLHLEFGADFRLPPEDRGSRRPLDLGGRHYYVSKFQSPRPVDEGLEKACP